VLYYLGKSYAELGNVEQARVHFNRLIVDHPSGQWSQWAREDLKKVKTK
ncbi:MAG: tetratricopeptide repeat protein, partial [Candidatus Omnitrophica bacterium]|nr:tetratricopeptide repeat protein [Candidatus Omnitrophota bacterium]